MKKFVKTFIIGIVVLIAIAIGADFVRCKIEKQNTIEWAKSYGEILELTDNYVRTKGLFEVKVTFEKSFIEEWGA